MALIKCTECGNQISNKAKLCPHCGHSKPEPKNYGCGTLILIGIFAWIIYSVVKPNVTTPTAPETPKTPEQIHQEKVSNLFFMGSSVRCENWIKKHLKDPDSFETIETKYLDKGDFVIVNVKYRAKNSFNGFVVDTGTCKLSLDNVVLEGTPN
jgi:hypothetical protein